MPRSGPPEGYVEVSERWEQARAKYPDARLQGSYEVVRIADQWFIAYTARAYRSPDDPMPGIGVAYEPVPGKTPYTRDSELQNAETSAWGRALVAAGMADAKQGIASADEVRARRSAGEGEDTGSRTRPAAADGRSPSPAEPVRQPQPITDKTRTWLITEVGKIAHAANRDADWLRAEVVGNATAGRTTSSKELTTADLEALRRELGRAAQELGVA